MTRRAWTLFNDAPLALQIAADARQGRTDPNDDQVWEIALGTPGNPALVVFTRYGGRVGMVSIVPMWWIDGQPIYETEGYHAAPRVIAFAPGYVTVEADLRHDLTVRVQVLALESHAVGITYAVKARAAMSPLVTLDVIGFSASDGAERKATLMNGGSVVGLSLGGPRGLAPVLLLERGKPSPDSTRKLTALLKPNAKTWTTARAVVAALADAKESRALADQWLKREWPKPVLAGARAADAMPSIETGNADLDAALAFSYQQALQAFIGPTGKPSQMTITGARRPDADSATKLAPNRVGGHPALAYLLTTAIAPLNPKLAQDVLMGLLAGQKGDGSIALPSGYHLGSPSLYTPILARLAWNLWQITEDDAFLRAVYPGLKRFFERWTKPDLDSDGDGAVHWQSEDQSAYPFLPIFSRGLPFGQNVDLATVESPDLAAFLLSEAISLREIAYFLRIDTDERAFDAEAQRLSAVMESFWSDEYQRYVHRDRDTHATPKSVEILRGGAGDQEHLPSLELSPPARVQVEIVGGTTRPNFTLRLTGIAPDGAAIEESADAGDFAWTSGRGTFTSKHAYARIDRIAPSGLIRLYLISAWTPDLTALDITALLPLWALRIDPTHRAALVALLTDPKHFWRAGGPIMFSAQDPHYDPKRNDLAAGVWSFWVTLLGEGLIEANEIATAVELFKRYTTRQIALLKRDHAFYEAYPADDMTAGGIGARGSVGGMVPIYLFLRIIGVRIVSETHVWTGGTFVWDGPVSVTHRGVTVRRSAEGTRITFPSGKVVNLPPDALWQQITGAST